HRLLPPTYWQCVVVSCSEPTVLALPSFPTRRSSDLRIDQATLAADRAQQPAAVLVIHLQLFRLLAETLGQAFADELIGAMVHRRSEEHTSELQSRENLVCRLLREKKKRHPGYTDLLG